MPGIDYVATSQAFPLPIGATRFFLTAPVTPSRQFVPYWLRMERDGGRLRQMIGQASLGIPDLINTIYCVNVEMHSVSALVNQEIGSGSISFYCPGKVQNTLETVLESAPARYLEKEGSFAREWKARAPPLVRSRDPQNERQPFFSQSRVFSPNPQCLSTKHFLGAQPFSSTSPTLPISPHKSTTTTFATGLSSIYHCYTRRRGE